MAHAVALGRGTEEWRRFRTGDEGAPGAAPAPATEVPAAGGVP
jgi:hypothetical protein